MKTQTQILCLAALIALTPIAAEAQLSDAKGNPGSLFNNSYKNPLTDRTARRVGDLITIVVDERTTANFGASTKTDKKDTNSVDWSFFAGFLSNIIKPFTTGASSGNSGSGATDQSSRMSARLTAVVKKVLPNGSLAVEAARTLVTNRETQTLKLTGVVRLDDIQPDNTVASSNLAEAEIRMEGKGAVYDRQRKGLLTQVIDWLF